MVLVALAAELTGTDGSAAAESMVAASGGGDGQGQRCTDFAACKSLIAAGAVPDYDGVSGPLRLNGYGDPTIATYARLTFGADNRIAESLTTFATAEAAAGVIVPPDPVEVARAGDGVLRIGTLLPQTGNLSFLGPPSTAGAELAIADINAAGGVLGQPVEHLPADSGDASSRIVGGNADLLLAAGADAVIGPLSTSVTLLALDQLTAAGVTVVSPGATGDVLSVEPDRGLFFRVAPPDALQGAALAQLVLDEGDHTAYVIAIDEERYTTGQLAQFERDFGAAGGTIVGRVEYDPTGNLTGFVGSVRDAAPDAIVLVGFDETSKILRALVDAGIGPTVVDTFGVDGNTGDYLGEAFDVGD